MNNETKNQSTSDSIEALMLLTIGMSSSSDASLAQKVLDAIEDLQELQERRKTDSTEPVAWLHTENDIGIPTITRSRNVADSWLSKGWNIQPLYTGAGGAVAIPDELEIVPGTWKTPDVVFGWNACRAAMLQGKVENIKDSGEMITNKPPVPDWIMLATVMYQAAEAYNMPVRVMDMLAAAQNGEDFGNQLLLLPIEYPEQEDQE